MAMVIVYFTIGTFEDTHILQQQLPVSINPCEYRLLFVVNEDTLLTDGKTLTITSKMNEVIELLPNDILLVDQLDRTLKLNDPNVYDKDDEIRLKYNIGTMIHVNVLVNPSEIHSKSNAMENALNKFDNLFNNDKNKDKVSCDMDVNDGAMEERVCFPN